MDADNKYSDFDEQLSIFDTFVDILNESDGSISDAQLFEAASMLQRRAEIERLELKRLKQEAQDAHIARVTSMELPMDWENLFLSDSISAGVHASTPADGLILSLSNLGRVDIEYISAVCSQDYKSVICALRGSIYQNPETWGECFYKGWETSDEYLSGNMLRKLKAAQNATEKYNGYFDDNVAAIKRVLPPKISTDEIYVTLGSPWIPPFVIDDFIAYLLGDIPNMDSPAYRVRHDSVTGAWEIPKKGRYAGTLYEVRSNSIYGTKAVCALQIIEQLLNMKSAAVYDERKNSVTGKRYSVLNNKETILAAEKQEKILDKFRAWVWKDKDRKELLERIYAEKYGSVCRRRFDGSFLTFPGMTEQVELYAYQKNAVARILFSPNTLLAHEVGAGKTYIMAAAGMELRRMGLSKKNMYVVPKNILGQWRDLFAKIYPQSDVLCIETQDFTPDRREHILRRIRDEDHDAVLISYGSFEMIPLSRAYLEREIHELHDRIGGIFNTSTRITGRLRRKSAALEAALRKLELAAMDAADAVYFDQLGINTLFVDEAHNFKNISHNTNLSNLPGISVSGSHKCDDMLRKVRCVQRANKGGRIVLATGTPVSNSITDIFVMQQYLQSGELQLIDLESFDSWVSMFARKTEEFEVDVDTGKYRMRTRFSSFNNLPELTALLSSVADFHKSDIPEGLPRFDGYDDCLVEKSDELARYLHNISERADSIRAGFPLSDNDNMLRITSDGRKAALDVRLVDLTLPFSRQSKVEFCAQKAAEIYFDTADVRGTQLIFCDISTPKASFNIYSEMRRLLCEKGVANEHIAFVHDHDTPKRREMLFSQVRFGEVRILLGSTFKLGTGVNVQDRLVALHHLDVPWRPSDMVQREGRILRNGNMSERVQIFRYITEGSFDAYSWQLLESKQRFIDQLLSGTLAERSGADVDDTTLNYAEVKALAIGNPLLKKRVETANELRRLLALQQRLTEEREAMERELALLPGKIETQRAAVGRCREDIAHHAACRQSYSADERKIIHTQLARALRNNVLRQSETRLMTYQGLDIILPANMLEDKPFIWLEHSGRYYVEMGRSDKGVLVRIDNFLSVFDKKLEHLETGLNVLHGRQRDIIDSLAQGTDYSKKIEKCKKQLAKLDNILGV